MNTKNDIENSFDQINLAQDELTRRAKCAPYVQGVRLPIDAIMTEQEAFEAVLKFREDKKK